MLGVSVVALALVGSGCGAGQPEQAQTGDFEYVVTDGRLTLYDIDQANRFVRTIELSGMTDPHGVVASPATAKLYVSYGGESGEGNGSMLAYDLIRDLVLWRRDYDTGIDSMAITPDGGTIYMPQGESSESRAWSVIDAATGKVTGAIEAGAGPHNTVMGLDGRFVYLGAIRNRYLTVVSTATNKVVRKIGPLHGPGAGRPFTVNGSQTLVFNTASSFLGFQVSSIKTGKLLYTVAPPGFTWDAETFGRTPNHGISLSPDERELYLIDTPNGYAHVFDVSRIPASRPRRLASIKLAHPPPYDGWLQHSRDGRYVYVGRAGDVIDTRTRKIVAFLPTMQDSAHFLEITWRDGRPVSTTNRYGVGYVTRR